MSNKLMNECSLSEWTTNFILDSYSKGFISHSSDINEFIKNFPIEKKLELEEKGLFFDPETFQDVLFFELYTSAFISDWSDYLNAFQKNNPRLSNWFQSFEHYFTHDEVI
jgi:hypothetical protein